jgi:hypothetical protein
MMDSEWIYGKRTDLDAIKELKVKLPLRFHVKLHSMKLLSGKTMASAVGEALEAYFANAATELVEAASATTAPASL